MLTHWGQMTHICVSKLTILGSDNSLLPDRRQAIIRTNAGILLIRPLRTNVSEIQTFSFRKMHLKISSAKWRPFCLGLNVLRLLKQVPDFIIVIKITGNNSYHCHFCWFINPWWRHDALVILVNSVWGQDRVSKQQQAITWNNIDMQLRGHLKPCCVV